MNIDRYIELNPVTVASHLGLKEAIAYLSDRQQYILVIDEKLCGIVTQGDVLKAISEGIDLETATVAQVMTQPVISITYQQCRDLSLVCSYFQRYSLSCLPILNEGQLIGAIDTGTIAGLLSTFTKEKSDNTKELAHFFAIAPSLLCIAGFDGYFKRVNLAFESTLGFTTEELSARPLINFVHPEDRAATLRELDKLCQGQNIVSFENRYLTRDGGDRWLWWTAESNVAAKIIYATARDITERKAAELALQESEARWQLALRGANDGIWDWNVKTNEVFFSRRWKEMLGFGEDEIENSLEEWSKRVHPDDLDWVTNVIQDHFAGKTPFYITEHRVACKDGSYKWILDRGQALWDETGNVVRMAGSHTDITQRKAAEEKLAKSENLLRTIIESEPECVKLLARDGTLLDMNPAGLAIIEADSLADLKGQSVYPLVNSPYRQAFIDLTEEVFAGKSGKLEFELTGLKGTSRWLSTNVVPLREENEIIALLAVTRDISERKRIEIQLQQERDFSQAIVNTVGALIAVLDRQGRIVSLNRTCETVTGYSFSEVFRQPIWEFLIPTEEVTAVKGVFERLFAGQFSNHYENTWIAKNGSRHLISWSNTVLFDERGVIEFVIATGIDVTEQRRVWNKLEQQYRQTKLLSEMMSKIRMSIELEDILQSTVTEIQLLLACDRALIVRIEPNGTALPIGEAVLPELPSMLGYELADPLLVGEDLARYRQGEILAIEDLATASIAPEIQQLLGQFQVRAKLVIPILAQNELKSLLVIHQCHHSRQWQESEIELLKQLADRIGVAISQAQLLDNLEEMVERRTDELTTTNQLLELEIAERKQTEASLRENQQKLTGILDNADEAIISLDEQQRIELFNQSAEKTFGYQAEDIIGKPLDILLPKAFRQAHRQYVNRFKESAEQSRSMAERDRSIRGLRQDGTEFPAEASIAKLQTKAGIIFTVMLKDITEREQTQAKLKASKTLLSKAEKIAKIGSWEYDSITHERAWSEELFNILGFPSNCPIPSCQEILSRVHPEDRLLVRQTLRRGHIDGVPWQFDYRLLMPDGTIKFVASKGEPILNEMGVIKVLETIMDVSDRVRAEKSRQRSEEQLKLITDALPILIAYIDRNCRYSYNNRTYETWYGRPRTNLIGVHLQEVVGKANYRKMLPYLETVLAGKTVTFESQYVSDSGVNRWMSSTYIPDFDLNGEVKGFFSMVDDITERKTVEQMKSEFVSIASHEMRTPLTSIHGVIELLHAGRLGELTMPGRQMTELALRNSDRLVRLLDDILDLERMESGRETIERQSCNSAELILQAVDTLSSMAKEQQISLETNARPIEFQADRDRIVQTLTNLISNAIKFSPAKGKVAISCQPGSQEIIFSVKDRGRGIPADKLESIFERFQQVDASDSRHKGGTGLGLSICRHIVEQHGGKIWVESVYGRGSTFYFSLPVS